MLFVAGVLSSALLTLAVMIYYREHLRKYIGYYMIPLCLFGAYAGWNDDGWIMLLMIPVILWKVPPFNNKDKLFAWAASKDPLGTKKATAKFLEGKAWYWWVGYALLLWALASVVVSLISGEPTLVIVG